MIDFGFKPIPFSIRASKESISGWFVDGVLPNVGDTITLVVYESTSTNGKHEINCRFKAVPPVAKDKGR